MITLITGVPGAGKTALAIAMLLQEQKGRPLFVDGVAELKLDHQACPPLPEWTQYRADASSQDGKKLCYTFPPNSLIVIDEAQRVFRPRGSASAVPPHVAAFETHRHEGLDFWLITQHAGLLDTNIRKLVTRHVHLRTTFLGRRLHEATECTDMESRSARELTASRKYKLPRKVFSLYKSAEVHTKIKRRMPFYFYVFLFGVVSLIAFAGYMYSRVSAKLAPTPSGAGVLGSKGDGLPGSHSSSNSGAGAAPKDWFAEQAPRVAGLAHTAPVYDGVTVPKSAPFPAACIKFGDEPCKCYTDQATVLAGVPEEMCRSIVAGGLYMPWREPERRLGAGGEQIAQAPATRVVASAPAAPHASVIPDAPPEVVRSHIRSGPISGGGSQPKGGAPSLPSARQSGGS